MENEGLVHTTPVFILGHGGTKVEQAGAAPGFSSNLVGAGVVLGLGCVPKKVWVPKEILVLKKICVRKKSVSPKKIVSPKNFVLKKKLGP